MATYDGWQIKYPTMDSQAEFFLLKFGKDSDIKRDEVLTLKEQFKAFAKPNAAELQEDEAMRLLEKRNQTKTFKELRQMVADIDLDKNRKLSFLEWACAIYSKSWDKLHALVVDPEEIAKAEAKHKEAQDEEAKHKRAEEEATRLEDEKRIHELRTKAEKAQAEEKAEVAAMLMAELKRQEEERKKKLAEEEEEKAKKAQDLAQKRAAELKRQGVAGKVALFKYFSHDSKDVAKDNEKKVKDETARKKLLKQQEIEALAKQKLAEEESERKKAHVEEAHRRALVAEKEARAATEVKAEKEKASAEAAVKIVAAEEEKKKALQGKEAERAMIEEYEKAKKEEEEKQRRKKEEEEKKRLDGRSKLMAKSNLWNNNTSKEVVKAIPSSNTKLKKGTETKEATGLERPKLLGQVRRGTILKATPGMKVATEVLTDDDKANYLVDQMRKQPLTE